MKKVALLLVAIFLFSYSAVFADIIAPQDDLSGEVTTTETLETSGEVLDAAEDVVVSAPSGSSVQESQETSSTSSDTIETPKAPSPLGAIIAIVVVIVIVGLVAFISK